MATPQPTALTHTELCSGTTKSSNNFYQLQDTCQLINRPFIFFFSSLIFNRLVVKVNHKFFLISLIFNFIIILFLVFGKMLIGNSLANYLKSSVVASQLINLHILLFY